MCKVISQRYRVWTRQIKSDATKLSSKVDLQYRAMAPAGIASRYKTGPWLESTVNRQTVPVTRSEASFECLLYSMDTHTD